MQKDYVRQIFDSIAYRYDLLNHLLSGGIDFYWRRAAIETLRNFHPERILDVATGTADFAVAAMRLNPKEVVGIDISEAMLALGRDKVERKGFSDRIRFEIGDAQNLGFESHHFDAAIVAFGVRNFEDLGTGLREMHRVLKPGGIIVILEFSKPKSFPFKHLYFFYISKILPFVGRTISRSEYAYRYLPDSVMGFPQGDDFTEILVNQGFSTVRQKRLTFGIATVYTGIKGG